MHRRLSHEYRNSLNDAHNLLELQNVGKAYGGKTKQFLAVKDINLHYQVG